MSPVASVKPSNGLAAAAEIDCCGAPLARVADAVAALSCEAARWGAAAFTAPTSGYSTKDEADVAADLKTFLKRSTPPAGSREAGRTCPTSFADVPAVHGNFRQAVRALRAKVRVEPDAGQGKDDVLMLLATQFATSAHLMCKMSVDRARHCAGSIANAELREGLTSGVDAGDLNRALSDIVLDSDAASVLRRVYEQLIKFRDCLEWGAAVAMAVIETDSSVQNQNKKSKKKEASAEGTSSLPMLIRDLLPDGGDNVPCVNAALVADWKAKLSLLFDPKCPQLGSVLEKLKELLEGKKETRRLPKIPKVIRSIGHRVFASVSSCSAFVLHLLIS
jgi:histidyl-tRNA synthetase